jgi:V8-like Glu-specific endopeptidase
MQYIMNTFYKWNEYDVGNVGGKNRFCVVMELPVPTRLSKSEAQVLLSASRLWLESKPDPRDGASLDTSDPELNVPPVEPPSEAGLLLAEHTASAARQGSVIGWDDRRRVTSTTNYPWNTFCYLGTTYPGGASFRGSGCLVGPNMVLTAAHVVYSFSTHRFVSRVVIAPAQSQAAANATVLRPYGTRNSLMVATSTRYTTSGASADDYGAVFFSVPFNNISTYMPVEFNNAPTAVNLAGYPSGVLGETNSQAMWWGYGRVTRVESRLLKYEADATAGNDGSPLFADTMSGRRLVGLHSSGAVIYNAGPRLVTANQATIQQWMQWRPICQPPTHVSASDGTYYDKVLISWTASSGAMGYKIFRNSQNESLRQIGTTAASPYSDSSAAPGVTYCYWVKAFNGGGDSGFSNGDSGYRRAGAPPAPTNVSASDGTYGDKVVVTWTAALGAAGYKVFRSTSNNSATAAQIGTVTARSYADTSATPNRVFYYWVKAYNSYGDSAFSAGDSGYRSVSLLPPGNVSAWDGVDAAMIFVTWTASPGATVYRVFRSRGNNSATATQIGEATGLLYVDFMAEPGLMYYYWVKAHGLGGDSAFSNGDNGYCRMGFTTLIPDGRVGFGNIYPLGDEDWFQFTVSSPRVYAIESIPFALPDTFMYLYGPNSWTNLLETDDNDGEGNMAAILRSLSPGVYYVRIRASGTATTGPYRTRLTAL